MTEHHRHGEQIGALHWKAKDPESHNYGQRNLDNQEEGDVDYLRDDELRRRHADDQ